MNRNTYLSSQYTVPSLSLASSRSKKTIPTKDIDVPSKPTEETKSRNDYMDRINRPPIFNSKINKQSRISVENSNILQQTSQQSSTAQTVSINRNVYLQQDINESQMTFRKSSQQTIVSNRANNNMVKSPSGSNLLRNPQSSNVIQMQMGRRLENKKVDVSKSLFDRKIKKLLQQAEFYDKQLMGMYPDNSELLEKELNELQKCRKEALSFSFNSSLIDII